MANVIFKFGTRAQYDALAVKDTNTLYWLTDTLELMKGEACYGKGMEATNLASGLMSATDKQKLDSLISSAVSGLTAVDNTIVIAEDENGKTIGVRVSAEAGNAISVKEDGLFVPVASASGSVEFELERQATASEGYAATYKLKRTEGETAIYVGDEINIPKDMVLQSGTLEIATEADVPYVGAVIGDPYIDLVLNDPDNTHIYIPTKGLVDTYSAGDGIQIESNVISAKVDEADANGLAVGENGLSLAVATAATAGAMSAEDKTALDTVMASIVWGNLGDEETA